MKILAGAVVLAAILAAARPAVAQDSAETLYKTKCQVCHGPDGKGDTLAGKKVEAKNFHSPEIAKMSDEELFKIAKEGKGKMPAYDKKLTDDQIKSLIKYIRSLK